MAQRRDRWKREARQAGRLQVRRDVIRGRVGPIGTNVLPELVVRGARDAIGWNLHTSRLVGTPHKHMSRRWVHKVCTPPKLYNDLHFFHLFLYNKHNNNMLKDVLDEK